MERFDDCSTLDREITRKLEAFVGNRVGMIHELTKGAEWRHVETKNNPADIVSRGICASNLETCNLWWHWPSWLSQQREYWPESKLVLTEEDIKTIRCHERKATAIVNVIVKTDRPISNEKGSCLASTAHGKNSYV